jgi:hypothetical protein
LTIPHLIQVSIRGYNNTVFKYSLCSLANNFDSNLVILKVKNSPNQMHTINTQLENIVKENKIKQVAKTIQKKLYLSIFSIIKTESKTFPHLQLLGVGETDLPQS